MLRFILDRAIDELRVDVATLIAMLAAALRWPVALLFDLSGVTC